MLDVIQGLGKCSTRDDLWFGQGNHRRAVQSCLNGVILDPLHGFSHMSEGGEGIGLRAREPSEHVLDRVGEAFQRRVGEDERGDGVVQMLDLLSAGLCLAV